MDDRIKDLLRQGRELYDKGDYRAAEAALGQVAAKDDSLADVFDMLGVIAHGRGDLTRAEECFDKAVSLNPHYTEALLNLAITYNDRHKYAEARALFERMNPRRPADRPGIEPFARGKIANMHAELAQAYADMNMLEQAITQLEAAVGLCPSFADLRTRLGLLYRDAGQTARARDEFRAATEANPRYARAHVLLGTSLLALGDADGARASWERALAVDPDNARAASYLRMLDTPLPDPSA